MLAAAVAHERDVRGGACGSLGVGEVAETQREHRALPCLRLRILENRGQHRADGRPGDVRRRGRRLGRRQAAPHRQHTNLKDLSVGVASHRLDRFPNALRRYVVDLLAHFGHAELPRPVEPREPPSGDGLVLRVRPETIRQIEVAEFPFPQPVEQIRRVVDPARHAWRSGGDFGDFLEHVRARRKRGTVVDAPIVDVGVEAAAPLVDHRIHRLEPPAGIQGQAEHPAVAARHSRRDIRAMVLQEREQAHRLAVMVRMTLGVVVEPIGDAARRTPGVLALNTLETAVREEAPAQPVVLDVVAEAEREHGHAADRCEHEQPQWSTHPEGQRVPERDTERISPERIRVVPHRPPALRQPLAYMAPRFPDAARNRPRQVPPEALPLARRHRVRRRRHPRVVNVDMLRGVVPAADRAQQELAVAAPPCGAVVNQLVAGNEDDRGHVAEHHRHEQHLPDRQTTGIKHPPEHERERWRPERDACVERQPVPEQLPLAGLVRVHVPLFHAEEGVQGVHDEEEDERSRDPPPALDRGVDDQEDGRNRQEVGDCAPKGRLDGIQQYRIHTGMLDLCHSARSSESSSKSTKPAPAATGPLRSRPGAVGPRPQPESQEPPPGVRRTRTRLRR